MLFSFQLKWSEETYDLLPLPPDVAKQIFIPLTKEEKSLIPTLWQPSECKPSQDLSPPGQPSYRVLKPDMADMMRSLDIHHSSGKKQAHNILSKDSVELLPDNPTLR